MATFRNVALRVWAKVNVQKNLKACWEWTGARTPPETGGYGFIRWQYKHCVPHRIAYEWVFGPITDGLLVTHKCDNKLCCNPNHLRRGTQSVNMRDCYAKGRGGNRAHPRLKPEQIAAIKKLLADGVYAYKIAPMFKVSLRTIYRIKHGDTFKGENGTILMPKGEDRNPRKPITHCKQGHPFTPANTLIVNRTNAPAHRTCRICRDAYMVAYRANGNKAPR